MKRSATENPLRRKQVPVLVIQWGRGHVGGRRVGRLRNVCWSAGNANRQRNSSHRRPIVVENEELTLSNDHHFAILVAIEIADGIVAVAIERTPTAGVDRRVLVGPALAPIVVVDRIPGDHFLKAVPIEIGDGRHRAEERVVSDSKI